MSIRFIQANCREGKKVDLRQAAVVKRYKPDIIFFELPSFNGNPSSPFNAYGIKKKLFARVEKIKKGLRHEAGKTPYALSDAFVWDNIATLWREGHNVLLFNVDAPQKLRQEGFAQYGSLSLPRIEQAWQFWAQQYVRETIMASHIERILKRYSKRKKLVVAVFLQNFHWHHVQFRLKHPTPGKVWRYYFWRSPKLTPSFVTKALRKERPVLYRYWKKYSVW